MPELGSTQKKGTASLSIAHRTHAWAYMHAHTQALFFLSPGQICTLSNSWPPSVSSESQTKPQHLQLPLRNQPIFFRPEIRPATFGQLTHLSAGEFDSLLGGGGGGGGAGKPNPKPK